MRTVTLHEKDIIINRDKLKKQLDSRGMGYIELHEKIVSVYGLDLTYKGFMTILSNRATWKLLYAHAITDVLNVGITDVFDVIDIDIEEKAKEKKKWQEKYQNKGK